MAPIPPSASDPHDYDAISHPSGHCSDRFLRNMVIAQMVWVCFSGMPNNILTYRDIMKATRWKETGLFALAVFDTVFSCAISAWPLLAWDESHHKVKICAWVLDVCYKLTTVSLTGFSCYRQWAKHIKAEYELAALEAGSGRVVPGRAYFSLRRMRVALGLGPHQHTD